MGQCVELIELRGGKETETEARPVSRTQSACTCSMRGDGTAGTRQRAREPTNNHLANQQADSCEECTPLLDRQKVSS